MRKQEKTFTRYPLMAENGLQASRRIASLNTRAAFNQHSTNQPQPQPTTIHYTHSLFLPLHLLNYLARTTGTGALDTRVDNANDAPFPAAKSPRFSPLRRETCPFPPSRTDPVDWSPLSPSPLLPPPLRNESNDEGGDA